MHRPHRCLPYPHGSRARGGSFGLPSRLRLVHLQGHPVRPCLQSLVVGARLSSSLPCGSVIVPARGAQSPNDCGRPWVRLSRTASPPTCPSILLLLLRVSHGREPVLEPVYRLDWHYDHRPPTPRLQCSVNRNHQHKAAERLALTARLSLRTGLVDVKKFHMSLESSAKPAVSSRGSRL